MVRKLNPERRERFLNAALRLFVAQGVQHTSTAEIARQAGSAAGTLFLYFTTKQDLLHELVLKIGREQSEYIQGLLTPALAAREAFFTIWSGSLRWFMEHPEAYRYIRQVRDSGTIAAEVVAESARYLMYYDDAIQKGLAEGVLKPCPPEVIGEILYQDIIAGMNLLQRAPDAVRQAELVQMGFDIFWDGIRR